MYSTCLGHMEGEIEKVALLITSHAVYILTSVPGDLKYTVLSTIKFQHIDYLSVCTSHMFNDKSLIIPANLLMAPSITSLH